MQQESVISHRFVPAAQREHPKRDEESKLKLDEEHQMTMTAPIKLPESAKKQHHCLLPGNLNPITVCVGACVSLCVMQGCIMFYSPSTRSIHFSAIMCHHVLCL